MTEQMRQRYLEALIWRATEDPAPELLDRIERLLGIAGAIEQPRSNGVEAEVTTRTSANGEAAAARAVASPIDGSQAVASPPGDGPAASGEVDDHAGEAGYPQPATSLTDGSTRSSPAASPVSSPGVFCRFCRRPFPSRRGIHNHERRCESNPDRLPSWVPTPEGTASGPPPPAAPAVETFLCERCQEPFPSRQALAEHRRGHPEIPPAAPLRRAFRGPVDSVLGGTG